MWVLRRQGGSAVLFYFYFLRTAAASCSGTHLGSGLGSPPRGQAKNGTPSRGLHHAGVLWACARPFGSVRFCLPHFAACVAVCLSALRSPSLFSPDATAGPDEFRCRTGPSPVAVRVYDDKERHRYMARWPVGGGLQCVCVAR